MRIVLDSMKREYALESVLLDHGILTSRSMQTPESSPRSTPTLADLQNPSVLRLHLGELTPEELLIARAAVRFCYSQLMPATEMSAAKDAV